MKKLLLLTITLCMIASIAYGGGGQATSGLTIGAIITNARYYLNEQTSSYWGDDELLTFARYGIADIIARTRCLEFSAVTGFDAGVTRANIAGIAHYGINSVIMSNTSGVAKGLVPGKLRDMGNVRDVGEPVYWTEENGFLYVYPPPDSGISVEITGVSNPYVHEADQNEAIKIPAMYDSVLLYYVIAQALYKHQKPNLANVYMTQYYQALQQFREDYVGERDQTLQEQRKQ